MAAFVESIPGVRRVFYGWWIVAVGIAIAILNGAFYTYGFGVYFIPLLHELGASRAALGGVVGLARLEGGLIAPLAGWLIDRYGPRPLLYFGIITMGIAFVLLSMITSLWMLYAVFMIIATASSFGGGRPINVAVANWFVRKRARALGILLAGIGLGGSAVFIVGWLTQTYGWRTAAVMAALAYWLVGIPLVSLVHHRPEQLGMHPDGEPLPVEAPSRDRSGSREPLEIELTPAAGPQVALLLDAGHCLCELVRDRHRCSHLPRPVPHRRDGRKSRIRRLPGLDNAPHLGAGPRHFRLDRRLSEHPHPAGNAAPRAGHWRPGHVHHPEPWMGAPLHCAAWPRLWRLRRAEAGHRRPLLRAPQLRHHKRPAPVRRPAGHRHGPHIRGG